MHGQTDDSGDNGRDFRVRGTADPQPPTRTTTARQAAPRRHGGRHRPSTSSHSQLIANVHDDTRSSGTPGFDASASYVARKARAAGYDGERAGLRVRLLRGDGAAGAHPHRAPSPGDVHVWHHRRLLHDDLLGQRRRHRRVQAVDTAATPTATSTSGCEAADFAGFPAGTSPLMQRGTCTLRRQGHQRPGRRRGGGRHLQPRATPGRTAVRHRHARRARHRIPVVGTSFAVGQALYSTDGLGRCTAAPYAISETRTTQNVLAETQGRRPRQRGDRRRAPRLASPRARASTTTAAARPRSSRSPSSWRR